MLQRDHGDDRKMLLPGFRGDLYDHFVDSAVGEDEKAVRLSKDEIAHDHLPEAFHMLEEHGLPLTVWTDHGMMAGKRELNNGVKAGKASVPRKHLFYGDARVAGAE